MIKGFEGLSSLFGDGITLDLDLDMSAIDDRTAIPTAIQSRIRNGATVEDIAEYNHDHLKEALTYFKVPNRSFATTKYKMAQLLVKWFGGAGYNNDIQMMLATMTTPKEEEVQEFLAKKGYYD